MKDNRPTVAGKVLEESDIGRKVWYVPAHAKSLLQWQKGTLSSFRIDSEGAPAIFVKYKSANGERTNPSELLWRIGE